MQHKDNLFIISSVGRSGSSLMFNSLRYETVYRDGVFNTPIMGGNQRNHFWKCHYRPLEIVNTPITFNRNIKNIFLYRDPIEIVLSLLSIYRKNREEHGLKGEKFIKAHCNNMRRNWDLPLTHVVENFDNLIIEKDILELEKMYDSFVDNHRFDTLMVNYDSIWENKNKIEDYVNGNINLPEKENRDKKNNEHIRKLIVSDSEYKILNNTYESLIQKIKNNRDCWLIKKKL